MHRARTASLVTHASALVGSAALAVSWFHRWGWDVFYAALVGAGLFGLQLVVGGGLLAYVRWHDKVQVPAWWVWEWSAGVVATAAALHHAVTSARGC